MKMDLFDIPDPVSMFESAATAKLERTAANALVSSTLSGWISFIWTLGAKPLFGVGQALRAMATAQYLTLSKLETKNFLTLSVPNEMLEPENLSKYETEWK